MARETIHGISVPVPGTGEPPDFVSDLRRIASDLPASFAGHVNGYRDAVGKIRNQQQDVNLLFVTDSTGDLTHGGLKWTTGFAAALGALYPTHTVYEHTYDYTTADDWNAATLIQTGTGYRSDLDAPPEIHVWVAGWAAHNWADWFHDDRRDTVFGAADFDTIDFGMGHNDGYTVLSTEPIKSRTLAFVEWARSIRPRAQPILGSQNPREGTGAQPSPGHAEIRSNVYRSLSRERGYGFRDVTQAFHDDGRSLVPGAAGGLIEADGVHATAAGYALWQEVVLAQFQEAPGAVPMPSSIPSLSLLTKRLDGMHVRPVLANGWTGFNVTEATESTVVRGDADTSIKLTKTAGGQKSWLQRSLAVEAVRGRDVTAFGWLYTPSTPSDIKLTFGWFIDGVLVPGGATLVDTVMLDQWFPLSLTVSVPADATTVTGRLWVDNDESADTPSVYVHDLDFIIGNVPLSVADSTTAVTGTAPIDTWAATTVYTAGEIVVFNGSVYQAVGGHTASADFRADLAAGNWVHLNGHGRVESIDPAHMPGYIAFPAVNRAYYYRVTSADAISALAVDIGTQSGNILAAVYKNNGQAGRDAAPSELIASTGPVACPAVGKASLSLGGTFGVAAGDWIMLAADNTTVRFRAVASANTVGNTQGRVGFEALASLAATSPPGTIAWAGTYMPWVAGE